MYKYRNIYAYFRSMFWPLICTSMVILLSVLAMNRPTHYMPLNNNSNLILEKEQCTHTHNLYTILGQYQISSASNTINICKVTIVPQYHSYHSSTISICKYSTINILLYNAIQLRSFFSKLNISIQQNFSGETKNLQPVSYTHLDVYKRQVYF